MTLTASFLRTWFPGLTRCPGCSQVSSDTPAVWGTGGSKSLKAAGMRISKGCRFQDKVVWGNVWHQTTTPLHLKIIGVIVEDQKEENNCRPLGISLASLPASHYKIAQPFFLASHESVVRPCVASQIYFQRNVKDCPVVRKLGLCLGRSKILIQKTTLPVKLLEGKKKHLFYSNDSRRMKWSGL